MSAISNSDHSDDGEYLPSGEQLGNLSPAVSEQAVSLVDDEVLLRSPRRFLHVGIKMVVPALSTLLSQPALQMLGYQCPLFVAVEIHKLYDLRNGGYASELHLNPTGYTVLSESNFKPLHQK